MNTVKKEEAVKNQSKVSKSDSATLSLVTVPWLLLQSFDRFFLIESYLYSSFCFNISLQFLSATILKGFCYLLKRVLVLWFLKMPVNLAQYRVTVGIFNNRQIIVSLHYEASLYSGMLICDVEMNPGPLSNCKEYFSVCHWNLNSLSAHD